MSDATPGSPLRRAVLTGAGSSELHLVAPSLALPEIVFHLLWHRRSETDPAQAWLRDLIARHAAAL